MALKPEPENGGMITARIGSQSRDEDFIPVIWRLPPQRNSAISTRLNVLVYGTIG